MKLSIKTIIVVALLALAGHVGFAKEEKQSYNLSRAYEEIDRGNSQSAIEFLNKELAENPKNGLAFMTLAGLYFGDAEYGYARNAAESALKHLPKKDKESRAAVHLLRGRLLAIERDTVGAYDDYTMAIKLDPSLEDAYEQRAQLYYEQGRYGESDADYQQILVLHPGGVMGRMGLGRNYYSRKDYDKAIEQYDRVIALYPDYSSGYSYRADAYFGKEDYLKAIDDICRALEIDSDSKAFYLLFLFPKEQLPLVVTKLKALSAKEPHSAEYEYYTGLLYNYHKMYAKSNEALVRAFNIDAAGVFQETIAENYSNLGDYASALTAINIAIQMNPSDDDLVVSKADILGESGDIDGAIALWGEYIDRQPDYYGGYYRRGFFEDNSGKTEAALADYEMAVMLNPNDAYSHLGLGDMLKRLGRHDEALAAYQKVVGIDTIPNKNSCAMYALHELGRTDDAVAFMEKVIADDAENPGNYYDAACLYCRIGDNEKALEYLRTALEKGFCRIDHIRRDDDLDRLRTMPEFEELINEYEQKLVPKPAESYNTVIDIVDTPDCVEIPFTPAGGVYEVSCSINDLPLKFILDTGASIVSLSMVEANFMMKNGYLKPTDVVGSTNFYDANGDVSEGTVINLRQIDFGGLKLDNVRASVVRNQKAPLLLGQSVLGRLGKIEIDNQNKKLIIAPNK